MEEEDAAQIHVSGRSCPSVSYIVRHRRVVVWRVRAVLLFFFSSHVGATLRVWIMHTQKATHLFQSDASLSQGVERAAKARRTAQGATFGSPIWLGRGVKKQEAQVDFVQLAERAAGADGGAYKVISAHRPAGAFASSRSPYLWTAESGRIARCTNLETGDTVQQLCGHMGPVSGVATLAIAPDRTLICTASWDRSIRIWPSTPGKPLCIALLENAASDLLKALHMDATNLLLYSGGNDKVVRAWDLSAVVSWAQSLSWDEWQALSVRAPNEPCPKPDLVGVLQGAHTRPIVCISTLPPAPQDAVAFGDLPPTGTLFTADSMGRILQVNMTREHCIVERELNGHETSVHAISPVWYECEHAGTWTADVWTASSDQTVRRFPLSMHDKTQRLPGRTSSAGGLLGSHPAVHATQLISTPHKAHVVLPLGGLRGREVGAGTEAMTSLLDDTEAVLLGMEGGTLQVYRPAPSVELEGHWHTVTYVGTWTSETQQVYVVSASLDGTIRRWPMRELVSCQRTADTHEELGASASNAGSSVLTAEEEAELDELLSE